MKNCLGMVETELQGGDSKMLGLVQGQEFSFYIEVQSWKIFSERIFKILLFFTSKSRTGQ